MPNNRKPIIVSNPNDPRLRAYKDSLDFYSFNKRALDKVLKTNKNSLGSPVDVSKKRYLTREQDINETYNRYKSLGLNITKKDVSNEFDTFDKTESGKFIRKIGVYNFPIIGGGVFRLAQYKKPEQPVEYKREDIPALTPKTPTLNIQQPIDTTKVLPINKTVTPEGAPKKLPGGSGKFARYPNMKNQLGNLKTSRMVNAKKVENIVPTFVSGAKSLKRHKYLSGTKGLNDGFSDLVPGNTTQYAPDEKFFTDNNSPASANNNTVGWSGKTGEIQNKTISPKKVSVNKPATNYSIPNNRDFPNSYNRFDNFSDSFNDDFNEDMFWRPRQSPIEQMRNQQNYAGRNYTRFKFKSGIFNRPSFEQNSYQRTKHDVEYLTPKTPKFSFEQSKENSSVKPLSVESTPTSESVVKPKSGFAQYPNMKQGFFNRMADKIGGLFQNRTVNSRSVNNISATGPTFVSGAKSVKQYRGDENLPEAKNGMKNCGCKHPKKKYKYQFGGEDILADKLEFGENGRPRKNVDIDESNLDLSMYDLPETKVVQPSTLKRTIVAPNKVKRDTSSIKRKTVVPKKDTVIISEKNTVVPQKTTYPTVSGEKKVYIEKNPVITNKPATPTTKTTNRAKEYYNNYPGENIFPGSGKRYQLVDGKMVITKKTRFGKEDLGYDWGNLSAEEKNEVMHLYRLDRKKAQDKEIAAMNSRQYIDSKGNPLTEKQRLEQNWRETPGGWEKGQDKKQVQEGLKAYMKSLKERRGYKYGTGALTIPEGSAIVTANGGKNKQALMAYKKGNYKLLNSIIEDMPEDNVDKAQEGKQVTKVKGKWTTTDPTTKETYQEQSVLGGGGSYGKEMSLDKAQNLYNLTDEQFEAAYGKNKNSDAYKIERGRRDAVKEGNVTYTVEGKKGKDGKPLKYASGYRSKPGEGEKPKEGDKPKEGGVPTPIPPPITTDGDTGKRKEFVTAPSMAEIAARASILGQGIEGVPENYLRLGRYQYASQLPKTLREIQLAEQAGKETSRDVVAGDAGRYLAQAGNLSASRMRAANEAVIQDTLARQDILNKNVDLGNVEAQTNRGLKDQYAALRGQARSAYNDQLIGLGQRVDSATDTAREMSGQRSADAQRMQILKDLGLNYDYQNVGGVMKLMPKALTNNPPATTTTATTPDATGKKGLKKLKTYKKK